MDTVIPWLALLLITFATGAYMSDCLHASASGADKARLVAECLAMTVVVFGIGYAIGHVAEVLWA